jgi:GntR family transcriptional regulator/MocR family aminotransferase
MRTWDVAVDVSPKSETPVFLQIADGIAGAIQQGRLRAGDPLPGTRELARLLDVNRNTVVAAVDELRAQGFVESVARKGTVVGAAWREAAAARAPRSAPSSKKGRGLGFSLAPGLPPLPRPPQAWPPGTLVMQSGAPDVRLLPVEQIARAYRRALRRHGRKLLGYGDERGHPELRASLARMLAARRGLRASADEIVVVRGSQMGIDLAARALVAPGDVVAVEELGYSPAWAALLHAGARLLPIRIDGQGIDVDELARAVEATRVRAVYVTPHRQYPTTVSLAAHRRRALLDLCAREHIAILEDDFDHELQFEGRSQLPLAANDDAGVVVSIGTLSKILAPGLRLGFVCAPAPLVERLASLRRHVDRQGDLALEEAVAELLDDGTILRHARRMRRAYRARRDALVHALREHLGDVLDFEVPRGGMALWARTSVDPARLARHAADLGVGISTARDYELGGWGRPSPTRPYIRLGWAALDERELERATGLLARAARLARQ